MPRGGQGDKVLNMNATHKYVSVNLAGRIYFLHIVSLGNKNLYFATDFWGWPCDAIQTEEIVIKFEGGEFTPASQEYLDNCSATLGR